jgi:replicative DNA helicase
MNPNDDPSLASLRVPPHSIEAESSVLGALLLENFAWDRVGDLLKPADFYRHAHGLIFSSIAALVNANKAADVVTVFEHLQSLGKADEVGGLIYLNELAQYIPSAANIRRYAEIVRERSMSRNLLASSSEIMTLAYDQTQPIAERIDQATAQLIGLLEGAPRDDWQEADEGMVEFLDGIQRRHDGEEDFLSTGLDDLDEKLDGGMREGEVIVIAGRPSMGKTALALSIGEHVAQEHRASVGVLSMEMPKAQLQNRRVAMRSHVPLHKIKRPERMSDFEWGQMSKAVEDIRKTPMYISDQTALNINQVRSKARALKRRHGLRVLIVDYIGLMEGTDRKANRATQLGEVSRGIKALAKELRCTVLLLAQLNREVEKRPNQRPIMADLRECGDIEQDADVILFVHRPFHVKPDLGPEWKYYAEGILGKQRDGSTGVMDLQYVGESVRFCNWVGERPTSLTRTKGGEV